LAVLLDPLRRGKASEAANFIRVASLEAVPDDGRPRLFPVITEVTDAWTYSPSERVGAVYLRRLPGEKVVHALNVVCPHAGCFVGFEGGEDFQCPCHTSAFTLDGEIIRPSPSPRGMDPLETRIAADGDGIEVAFVNYYPGKEERIEKQ
jgi:Rieske Fe-S protein